MELHGLKTRKPRAAGRWYPHGREKHGFKDKPVSSAVISPHAGFYYSGKVSLEAVSNVKKNRLWIFGTSHYETPQNGISIFYGDYHSSIGCALFPRGIHEDDFSSIEKYLSDTGHRTEEHSIENVLYCLNHFKEKAEAFCALTSIRTEEDFEKISNDIAEVWEKDDSIIVSTDWNHFVSTEVIDELMEKAAYHLAKGEIGTLYRLCREGSLEACGIDGLYLAGKILAKTHENARFKVLTSTDSSKAVEGFKGLISDTCVGYISARN